MTVQTAPPLEIISPNISTLLPLLDTTFPAETSGGSMLALDKIVRLAEEFPSPLEARTLSCKVPTLSGVPDRIPVAELKDSQLGGVSFSS